jgi:single-strand DNA-binding protein
MAGVASITVVGNLAADPELRYGNSGKAQVSFKVIATRRRLNRDSQQWEDSGTLAPRCVAWEGLAENIAETLTKGMRVVVTGTLEERRYEDRQGQARTSLELTVEDVGPSLRNATASVTKVQRNSGGFQAGNGSGFQGGSGGQSSQAGYRGGSGYSSGHGGQGGFNNRNSGMQGGPSSASGYSNQGDNGDLGGYDSLPADAWAAMDDQPPF